jgi:parvulin-like peptidyl-prolyl isomerase
MTSMLQIGDRTVTATELLPLLIRYQLLPQLLRELLIDQAVERIECSVEETEPACQEFYEANQITDESARQAWMLQNGMSIEYLAQLATRPLRIEKFKQQTWGSKLESHFLTCKAQLDQVSYSLIRTAQPEVAQELYFRIQAGEQVFADLARQYSQGPEAETGGLLGPVPLTQPHPGIAEKLCRSQPGQLLPPTKMGEWYVILRLEKLIAAQLDDPTRQKLLDELFEAWIQAQLNQPKPTPAPAAPLTLAPA